ncbi:MAG: NTP transferase domain-containing protein [Caldiserica bacterium]|nr:NTP transferase domain-containing protein [Caldisericota bacterium]
MRTVVLAGGYAKRLWPLTLSRPKPLLPVAGRPILDYLFAGMPENAVPILSVNRRFADHFAAWLSGSGHRAELVIEETRSEEEKLGAVGALAYLVERLGIDEDLLVVGGDNIFPFALSDFAAAYTGRVLVALYRLGDRGAARRYGVAEVRGNLVVRFVEKPERPPSDLVSTACYLFPRRVLPLLREFLRAAEAGKDAPGYFLQWLLSREEVEAFVFDGPWFDIGSREAYIRANLHFNGGESWISPDAAIRDSTIRDSVILGDAVIEGCSITGCVVDGGTHLQGVTLQDVIVGRGSDLRRIP